MKNQAMRMLLGIMGLALAMAGCRSDGYYQDRAVTRAREYLLAETPDMPLYEQEYIKFNRPFMLVSQLTEGYRTGTAQICICWMVPENPDIYMVYGASGARMIQWEPLRIIRKNFNQPGQFYRNAVQAAGNDVIQNFFGVLSVESVNHIRFTLPGVWKCKFPLDTNPDFKLAPEDLAQAEKLPRYVLAWQIQESEGARYVVRGGTAADDTLKGFKPYFSGIFSEADFRANLTDEKPLIAPFGGVATQAGVAL